MRAAPTQLFGRYGYRRELGRGALGRVVEVEDSVSGEPRAAKIVPFEHGERIRWEMDLLASLTHPNLARVYELLRAPSRVAEPFSIDAGSWVLIQEFVPGATADRVLAETHWDVAMRARFATAAGKSIAQALAALHARGLIHGDIKPSNLIVCGPIDADAGAESIGALAAGIKLIDFGLAASLDRARPEVVGTAGFMAPEVWVGQRSMASDLFALGVTLACWLDARSVRLEGTLVRLELPDATPAPLRRLIDELVAARPEHRPSAREVVRVLTERRDAEVLLDRESAAERVARLACLPAHGLERPIAALIDALQRHSVVGIAGPKGSGKTRIVREAVLRIQRTRAAESRAVPTAMESLPAAIGHDAIIHDAMARLPGRTALREAEAAALERIDLRFVLEREMVDDAEAPIWIECGALDERSWAELVRDALGAEQSDHRLLEVARAASAGLSGRLCRLLAAAWEQGKDPSRPEVLAIVGREHVDRLEVPVAAQRLRIGLALVGGALSFDHARCLEAGVEASARSMVARGFAEITEFGLRLRSDSISQIFSTTPKPTLIDIARSLDTDIRGGVARACLDAVLGRVDHAVARFISLATEARESGEPSASIDILRLALERIDVASPGSSGAASVRFELADALRRAAHYAESERVLAELSCPRATVLRAEVQRLAGDAAAADRLLLEIDEADPYFALACAIRGRIAYGRSELEAARVLSESALERGDSAAKCRALETLVLLDAGGERAKRRLDALLALAAELDANRKARALSLAGSRALVEGDPWAAIRRFESAAEEAKRGGERALAATLAINLGLAHLDAGALVPAMTGLREGTGALLRSGGSPLLGRALYNLANIAYLLGDDERTLHTVEYAERHAKQHSDAEVALYCALVRSDIDLRQGKLRAALRRLDATASAHPLVEARRAHLQLLEGEVGKAKAALGRITGEVEPRFRADVELAEARLAALQLDWDRAESRVQAALQWSTSFESKLKSALTGAEIADSAGARDLALARWSVARALLDQASLQLDGLQLKRFRSVSAYQRAFAARPERLLARDAMPRVDSGRALLALARRVVAEQRPLEVLRTLAQVALEHAGAERAFVLSRRDDGALVVRASRGLTGELGEEHRPSNSIVSRVLHQRVSVISVDAIDDSNLASAASIHAMSLRSVLATPLVLRDGETWVLYLDDRLRPGAFDEHLLADIQALAELGAGALAAAQRLREERIESRSRARRARRLEDALEASEAEVQRRGGGAFAALVAESPKMRHAADLARRVAASGVSVLLIGESGTGKESVARAIAAASKRRQDAFVAESCAAIPETLLESTLFGHVRGAFTGADRDHRGLFGMADGGTLFLDELGEMPAPMQAKLLRALQEGEIRAVGSEKTRRVDVRVIGAARPDLSARLADGRFREDLYYRLAVVTIEIPPLRERVEDIVPLAHHFANRYAPERKIRIDKGAREMLRAHQWPGNVRELENEMRRALISAEQMIRPEHLSLDAPRVETLDLKSRTQTLELELLTRALALYGGNQTRAAKALGLSRFGLSKMMKRLGLDAERH